MAAKGLPGRSAGEVSRKSATMQLASISPSLRDTYSTAQWIDIDTVNLAAGAVRIPSPQYVYRSVQERTAPVAGVEHSPGAASQRPSNHHLSQVIGRVVGPKDTATTHAGHLMMRTARHDSVRHGR